MSSARPALAVAEEKFAFSLDYDGCLYNSTVDYIRRKIKQALLSPGVPASVIAVAGAGSPALENNAEISLLDTPQKLNACINAALSNAGARLRENMIVEAEYASHVIDALQTLIQTHVVPDIEAYIKANVGKDKRALQASINVKIAEMIAGAVQNCALQLKTTMLSQEQKNKLAQQIPNFLERTLNAAVALRMQYEFLPELSLAIGHLTETKETVEDLLLSLINREPHNPKLDASLIALKITSADEVVSEIMSAQAMRLYAALILILPEAQKHHIAEKIDLALIRKYAELKKIPGAILSKEVLQATLKETLVDELSRALALQLGNRDLARHIAKQGKSQDERIIFAGTNRQSAPKDSGNADANGNGSFIDATEALAERTHSSLNPMLMADIDAPVLQVYGATWSAIKGSGATEGLPDYYGDEGKLRQVYAQVHELANQHPDKLLIYEFLDDRLDILNGLEILLTTYPELLPRNVKIKLTQFCGEGEPQTILVIQGIGEIDKNYQKTVSAMKILQGEENNVVRAFLQRPDQMRKLLDNRHSHSYLPKFALSGLATARRIALQALGLAK